MTRFFFLQPFIVHGTQKKPAGTNLYYLSIEGRFNNLRTSVERSINQ